MKTFKYFLVLTFMLLSTLSCTKDDEGVDLWVAIDYLFNGPNDYSTHVDTTPVKTSTFFNPPNWIQGEWNNIDESSDMKGVKFTSNDFIEDYGGPSSWNRKMNEYDLLIEHEISYDSIYEVVIKNWGWNNEYIFKLDEYNRLHMENLKGYKTDWDNAELKEGTFRKK